jgi:hypothetical protein
MLHEIFETKELQSYVQAIVYVNVTCDTIISGSNCLCNKGYLRSEIQEPHSKIEAIVYVNVT